MGRFRRILAGAGLCVPLVLSLPADASDAENKQVFAYCSIVNLIATPEKYDGKRIRTEGVAVIGFEMNAIYLSRDSAEYSIAANGVGLALDRSEMTDELKKAVHLKWVVIEGEYHAAAPKETGWRGYIDEITWFYDPTAVFKD